VRILVTGGAGFIGSHLVDALLESRHTVRVLDDFSTGLADNLPARPGLTVLRGDIRDLAACRDAAVGCEAVFHEAALGSVPRSVADPATTHAVNATGTLNVFIAAHDAGARRVVYASSSSVYGDDTTLPKREDRVGEPLSPYAAAKRSNELDAAAFARCYGLSFVGLRYFNVYGPRQRADSPYAAVVPLFLEAALAGEGAVIHGDGEQTRSFTFVADVVAANLAALDAPLGPGEFTVVNVSSNRRHSVNDLWLAICRAAGVAAEPRRGPARAGDVRDSLADPKRARTLLGFEAKTTLEDGLARTLRAIPAGRAGRRPR
jgi:UDP-N-acetylglucosamine 4-epimerase